MDDNQKKERKQKPLIQRWLEDRAPIQLIKTAEQVAEEKRKELEKKEEDKKQD